MPQMAPINWTLLFLSFILVYLITTVIIYFLQESPNMKKPIQDSNEQSIKMNWKW